MKEQVTINSLEFAQKSREIHGTIAPRDLGRLGDMLFPAEGKLDYHLRGGVDAQGRLAIWMRVRGELDLVCQRCMGPVRHHPNSEVHFVVVPDEHALPAPEDEQDDVEYLVTDPRQDVLALVEDEILLGLPMAPLHEATECGMHATAVNEQKESPFKVLQGLKFEKR